LPNLDLVVISTLTTNHIIYFELLPVDQMINCDKYCRICITI